MLRTLNIRPCYNVYKQIHRNSSAVTTAIPNEKHAATDNQATNDDNVSKPSSSPNINLSNKVKSKSPMVAAAFAMLKKSNTIDDPLKTITIDEKIVECKTPEDLLELSEKVVLNRKQALKIVTTLAEWSVNDITDMSKFETDPRFVSLCQLLGRSSSTTKPVKIPPKDLLQTDGGPSQNNKIKPGDLSLVLNVTEEDKAVNIVSTLALPQMVKVLYSLAVQKKRSLVMLRTLAYNIASSDEKLDVKKGADVLFALASLNFPDEVVLEKVCNDLCEEIPICEKPAVISSISTSLGRLRYRNDGLLNCISDWIITHKEICRNQEFVSILLTLAVVNHMPESEKQFFNTIVTQLNDEDVPIASAWLDVVWSLLVLGKIQNEHYKSVLTKRFIQKMLSTNMDNANISWKKKLLNINGAAILDANYKGPTLDDYKEISQIPLTRTKEKQILTKSVLDTVLHTLPSDIYLKSDIDSGMGFLIDGECRIDGKMIPFPVIDKKSGQTIVHKPGKGHRVAIMCWDYHDNTRGKVTLSGCSQLYMRLLNQAHFRVLSVNYNQYKTNSKLKERVDFIMGNLKRIIRPGS